jgi:hypothetical protein
MKLSISSPVIVLVGPLPTVRAVVAVIDVGPGAAPIAIGGKRAHRERLASAARTARRARVAP